MPGARKRAAAGGAQQPGSGKKGKGTAAASKRAKQAANSASSSLPSPASSSDAARCLVDVLRDGADNPAATFRWLVGMAPQQFAAQHWEQAPLLLQRGNARAYEGAFSRAALLRAADVGRLLPSDMTVCSFAPPGGAGSDMRVLPSDGGGSGEEGEDEDEEEEADGKGGMGGMGGMGGTGAPVRTDVPLPPGERVTSALLGAAFDQGRCTVQFYQPQRHSTLLWHLAAQLEQVRSLLTYLLTYLLVIYPSSTCSSTQD